MPCGEKPEKQLGCASYPHHGSAHSPASLGEDAVRGEGERAGDRILGTARRTGEVGGLSGLSISSCVISAAGR